VSDRSLPNSDSRRHATKKFRHRRLARHLLDQAFERHLRDIASPHSSFKNSNNSIDSDYTPILYLLILVSFLPFIFLRTWSSSSLISTYPYTSSGKTWFLAFFTNSEDISQFTSSLYPFFLFSILFPSSPEQFFRAPSPMNATCFSVKFKDEILSPCPIPSPCFQFYYNYDLHQFLDILLSQFPQLTDSFPLNFYDRVRLWLKRNQICCLGLRFKRHNSRFPFLFFFFLLGAYPLFLNLLSLSTTTRNRQIWRKAFYSFSIPPCMINIRHTKHTAWNKSNHCKY